MVKITNILFFVLCLVSISTGHTFDAMHNPLTEDLELERQINLINKPPIKTIHVWITYNSFLLICEHIEFVGSLCAQCSAGEYPCN
jgi:hypothetical protein